MNPDRLLEIASGIRKALKAKGSGEYAIGDVRAFQKEDAFAIIEALEYCARAEKVPEDESMARTPDDDRYIYFAAKIADRLLPEECQTVIDIRDGMCIVDKQLFEIYAFDKKRGRAVRIV